MATKAKVKQEAAELLGITSVGGDYSGTKAAKVEEYYQEVYDQLKADELAIFPSTGPVPNKIKPHVAAMIAMLGTDTFGVSGERYNRIVARFNIALREIRKHTTPKYESDAKYTDY